MLVDMVSGDAAASSTPEGVTRPKTAGSRAFCGGVCRARGELDADALIRRSPSTSLGTLLACDILCLAGVPLSVNPRNRVITPMN